MKESYDFKEAEPHIARVWSESMYAKPKGKGKPFSMFLSPPNASGPMHVGNALMVALQDIVARYHRAKGEPTLWVPGTDHGGYETQVTYEQEHPILEGSSRKELFDSIAKFVRHNNEVIASQIKRMGASVDWSHLRYTLDEKALASVDAMFKQMVDDSLVYRSPYMVNYCTACATVLADVELKEAESSMPLYVVNFTREDGMGSVPLATSRPEFLFAVTHMLVHPNDKRYSSLVGSRLINPSSGELVEIVESKRKFDPESVQDVMEVFSPSHIKYDFEYAIRHGIEVRNLLDWDGLMVERYPGSSPEEARAQEVARLTQAGAIERTEDAHTVSVALCKKGHAVQTVIRMTWFLELDDEAKPIRENALRAIKDEGLLVYPRWREKGLVEWLGKMHNWPIARQNVWGIKIPVWYEVADPSLFTVWFVDKAGVRRYGNLAELQDSGVTLEEVTEGLERVYAAEGVPWTLQKQEEATYLPETDTFDTWFSSCAWSSVVFEDDPASYPSSVVVTGHDLLRLWVSRMILLGVYSTGRLPFKRVFFHGLLKSKDGQKMSKSLGNAVTLDEYLNKYGADVTRMALVSYTGKFEDFYFAPERLEFFKEFAGRLWTMGRISSVANAYGAGRYATERMSAEDRSLVADLDALIKTVGSDIEKYFLAQGQEKAVAFLSRFEEFNAAIQERDDAEHALNVFHAAFKKYIMLLQPYMPFMTEQLRQEIYTVGK